MSKPKYDSTVARIAGNVASGFIGRGYVDPEQIADKSVAIARAIVAETKRTEPETSLADAQNTDVVVAGSPASKGV